jgi:hypothetical protein
MEILLYLQCTDGIGTKLLRIVERIAVKEKVEICRSIYSLVQRLRKPACPIDISILLASSKKQLSEFLLIKEELQDIKIILILPDCEGDTISAGHELYPRFVSYIDSDFEDLRIVLGKMIENKYREEQTKK